MKRIFLCVFSLCIIFIAACTSNNMSVYKYSELSKNETSNSKEHAETVLKYVPHELSMPEDIDSIWGWDTYGDVIWVGVYCKDNKMSVFSFDTISDQWNKFDINASTAHNPTPQSLSVYGETFWVLFKESYSSDDLKNIAVLNRKPLDYYIYYENTTSRESSFALIPFTGETDSESSDAIICSVQAVSADEAILTTYENAYVIDCNANVISNLNAPILGIITHMWIKEHLYIFLDDSFYELELENLSLGQVFQNNLQVSYSSNSGNYLYVDGDTLIKYNPESGDKSELFRWMDVALSYSSIGGSTILENSTGDFFYPTRSSLIKITKEETKIKEKLTLLSFETDTSETLQFQDTWYSFTPELMDAIIKFNNTDPEYTIEIETVPFNNEDNFDRTLIEVATSKGIDIIDTSILPENAIKAGLLENMLPYIDSDEEISREDFVDTLLGAMIKNGGLYEYTDKFTLMTVITRPDFVDENGGLSIAAIMDRLNENDDLQCLSREQLLNSFLLASTAEFIDWTNMTCNFDSKEFKSWIEFLAGLPETVIRYENPLIFQVSTDFAGDVGYWARTILNAEYVVSGFPDASGTGSYFVKLNGPFNSLLPSAGDNTRVGIMASSENKDGAWRFVKTLILGDNISKISRGIPTLKENFENAITNAITTEIDPIYGTAIFTEEDAKIIREQVYNTTKSVRLDDSLFNIIASELNSFFAGQKNSDETATSIQSRVKIYLSEQS